MKTQPLDYSITLGEYADRIIGAQFQKVIDQEESVLKDKNPEPLHKMRVSMRRLSTAVQVFSAAVVLPKAANPRAIGKIAQRLGKTRDLDVLQRELTDRYQPLLQKEEQPKFDKVLKHLKQKREKQFLHLQKALGSDRYDQLKQAMQTWLDQPTYTQMGGLSMLQNLPDLLLPLTCQLFLHPGWLVGTSIHEKKVALLPIENAENLNQQCSRFNDVLHKLRKQTKQVRYQAEFFADFYPVSYLQKIEELKTIQDILGQIQDHLVLRQFLKSTLDADWAEVLPTIAQSMQQEQTALWQSWQLIQQRYLSPDFRQLLRSLIATPNVQVALQITANIKKLSPQS
jgi:CHAD domain-containing protein